MPLRDGIGAGPGRHVQSALVASGIAPSRVTAHLIDLDDDAFDHGRVLAAELGIASSIHFQQGDARSIQTSLPDVQAQIVKFVGLVEYLTDEQFLDLLSAVKSVMSDDATLDHPRVCRRLSNPPIPGPRVPTATPATFGRADDDSAAVSRFPSDRDDHGAGRLPTELASLVSTQLVTDRVLDFSAVFQPLR